MVGLGHGRAGWERPSWSTHSRRASYTYVRKVCTFALCTVCYVGFSLPTFLRTFALCTRLPYRSRPSAYLIKFISKNVPYFFGVICCGGKTQIRFKDQYHIGVSHTRLVLLNTSGLIRAQRGLIGTTCAKHPFG